MPVKNSFQVSSGYNRLGNKAAYRCYLLESFRPADIYAAMISSMCWGLCHVAMLQNLYTWSTSPTFSFVGMHAYTYNNFLG
jgi:hypothetical protein